MLNLIYFLKSLNFFKEFKWKGLTGPIIILMILCMMILPLPVFILDIFFTFNIAFSIMILLVAMFTRNTLEFAVFPTILLFSTLFRLALNVASTRIILLQGHIGLFAAGHVIESFGHFLVGGDFTIGIIIFIILIIINFVVITKGSVRIAEVGARFILDGMPGKQMSIDSDLHSGLIDEKKAKKRRIEIVQEADFYGSMDGASKFVRGDAIAGILIMIINIFGGLIIGISRHHLSLLDSSKIYTLLTIGDGLVAQLPSLMISMAAGIIVTRVSTHQNVSEQMIDQIFSNPIVILLSGFILGILGLCPGMPNLIFLLFTVLLLLLSWFIHNFKDNKFDFFSLKNNIKNDINLRKENMLSWNDVYLEDVIKLEIGNDLLPILKNKKNNNLMYLITNIRKKVARDIGFLFPLIHVAHNFHLSPSEYCIIIKGVEYGRGEVFYNQLIATNFGKAVDVLSGKKVVNPIFGLNAYWINHNLKMEAKKKNYVIHTPESIIQIHLTNIIFSNLKDFFGRQETQNLLDYISIKMPQLIQELVPNLITVTVIHKVLQNLLIEDIPIRDMRTILETLVEHATVYKDPNDLTMLVRLSLSKLITQRFFLGEKKIRVIAIEKKLENFLSDIVKSKKDEIEPKVSELLLKYTAKAIKNQESISAPLVIIVTHSIRLFMSTFLRKYFSKLIVLSYLEIADDRIISVTSFIKIKNINL